jgi:hypothetical protein
MNDAAQPEKLPPWSARNDRDRREMQRWVNAKLDTLDIESAERGVEQALEHPSSPSSYWRRGIFPPALLLYAKELARVGDMKLLRQLFPYIAEYINEKPRRRGERRSYRGTKWAVGHWLAIKDVDRIRQVWRENYDGKWKRHPDDGSSAVEIAAHRHGLKPSELELAMQDRKRIEKLFGFIADE